MPRMVIFRSNRECRDISVNADQVLWVCHYERDACALHFGKDCFVRVKGAMDEVVRKLAGDTDPTAGEPAPTPADAHMADLH